MRKSKKRFVVTKTNKNMRIKELHLRNIASIECADIDFEKDLNDGITGDPASIFLITGDTGAGKSVILDGISMALYKNTPRIAGVFNTQKNNFTNAEGESVRVCSIEQYTRLGISESTPSYSMVVFEGNDGEQYKARLTLGFSRGNTNNEGKRPLKYRSPKWEVQVGNADFTQDSVEQTILDAVGLTFEQFGRMAMLAQGQFAAFLTGDKSERVEILEQLTNTQHFTTYGEAIQRLFDKAKRQRDLIQAQFAEAQANPLAQTEVKTLREEAEKLLLEKQAVEQKITQNTNTLKQLDRLKQAISKKQNAKERINLLKTSFIQLSEDLEFRIQQAQQQDDRLFQQNLWLEERKDRDTLYTQHETTILKMNDYASKTHKRQELEGQLKNEQDKTESIANTYQEAWESAQKAFQEVQKKQQAIDTLTQQRAELNPNETNTQLTRKQAQKSRVEILQKALEQLAENQQSAQKMQQEIAKDQETLKDLDQKKNEAAADYQKKKTTNEEALQRLNTMKMSVNDTIVELRKRLYQEHTETCPLCGQPITQLHLDEEFQHLLTPLEEERQKTALALHQAEEQRNLILSTYHKAEGELANKKKTLEERVSQIKLEHDKVNKDARIVGLDPESPLKEQISPALEAIDLEINRLKELQKVAENLQKEINQRLTDKKPLDDAKSKADKVCQEAKTALDNNKRDIDHLRKLIEELNNDIDKLCNEINISIELYYPSWKSSIAATREHLSQEAKTYLENKSKHEKDKAKLEVFQAKIENVRDNQSKILASQPEWAEPFKATPSPSPNILNDWTNLLAQVSSLMASVSDCDQTIRESQSILEQYYVQTGKSQDQQEAVNLEEEGKSLQAQLEMVVGRMAQIKKQLEDYALYEKRLKDIESQLDTASKVYVKWEKLNRHFGGTRFRTLVQTYILRPLLNNANIYLEKITDRYTLTCSEDNEQLAILVLDRYNKNQVRSVTVLSGGERFMISLALSLALSSLNRPDMNVNILFIDEGFGTLDEKCLDSVMATLEKLQEIAGQINRRVGIISHREELEERIPVKIVVKKQGEGRSQVEIVKNI